MIGLGTDFVELLTSFEVVGECKVKRDSFWVKTQFVLIAHFSWPSTLRYSQSNSGFALSMVSKKPYPTALPTQGPNRLCRIGQRKIINFLLLFTLLSTTLLIVQYQIQEQLLAKARSLVQSKNFRQASKTLDRLSLISGRTQDEANYLKGLCEYSTGKFDKALETWSSQVPGTYFYSDATLKSGEWLESQGRFTEAEEIYKNGLKESYPLSMEIRHALLQLFWLEARIDEVSQLIQQNWKEKKRSLSADASETIANLRAHLSLDLEVYPIDHVKQKLEMASLKSPKDISVIKAKIEIALKTGQMEIAHNLIKQNSGALQHSQNWKVLELNSAIMENDLEEIIRLEKDIDRSLIKPRLVMKIATLKASKQNNLNKQIEILEVYLKTNPTDIIVMEELAQALIANKQSEEAVKIRRRRSVIDITLQQYTNLIGSDFKSNAKQMASFAERLGRWFEAMAFNEILAIGNSKEVSLSQKIAELEQRIKASNQTEELWRLYDQIVLDKKTNVQKEIETENQDSYPRFKDIAKENGVDFIFESGKTQNRQLPETMGGGVAIIDYNNDGLKDIFALQGGSFPYNQITNINKLGDRLFRNRGNGSFEDVTIEAGLSNIRIGYSHGVAVGDIDNDGDSDIFITRYGSYALLENQGNGTFKDKTIKWNLGGERDWPTSAAFADFDNDGDLDLYVCHYVVWETQNPRICNNDNGSTVAYCAPHVLKSRADHLFRNDQGRFTDISDESGITGFDQNGKGLGVVAADFDDDGLIDIFVANDGTPNFLFRNHGAMRFRDEALSAGVSANSDGGYQAGMGVGCGDYNQDGRLDLIVTNFYNESTSYFENMGNFLFRERGDTIGLKLATRYKLGFGTVISDFNNDGKLDIATANGHVNDSRPIIPYQMSTQVLLGSVKGRLKETTSIIDSDINIARLGRGLALGDLNNDGLQDIVQMNLDSNLAIFINYTTMNELAVKVSLNSLMIHLEGVKSNRDGVGTKIIAKAKNMKHHIFKHGGGSYLSASSGDLHIGVGRHDIIELLEVRWPSGQIDKHQNVMCNRKIKLKEGSSKVIEIEHDNIARFLKGIDE